VIVTCRTVIRRFRMGYLRTREARILCK